MAAALLLAACGDGGGDRAPETATKQEPPPPPPSPPPEILSLEVTPAAGTIPLRVDIRPRKAPYPVEGAHFDYFFDFGDGSDVYHYHGSHSDARHTYTSHGTHTVTVTVRNEHGADTATATVDLNAPPVAHIAATKDHDVPFKVDYSAAGSHDSDGTIVSYEWHMESPRSTDLETSRIYWDKGASYIYGFNEEHLDPDYPRYGEVGMYLTVTDDKGATDVAEARVVGNWNHSVAGLHGLIERVKAAGGPFGVLPLMDVSHGCSLELDDDPDHSYCRPSHPRLMRAITLREGVPDENVLMQWEARYPRAKSFATRNHFARARAEGLVVSDPTDPFTSTRLGIEYLERLNMAWVVAAGNNHDLAMHYGCREPAPGFDNRDYWNINHPVWDYCEDLERDGFERYPRYLATVETGRVLVAATYGVRHDGTETAHLSTNFCGDLMENCFSMLAPHTSGATATLGAVMYYFMHMYDDAAEAVAALKRCTRDLGEPGVDRVFGQGAVDLRFCPEAHLPILDPATRALRRGPNLPPIPRTGGDRTVKLGDAVTLDGSRSTDPEGSTLLYHWYPVPEWDPGPYDPPLWEGGSIQLAGVSDQYLGVDHATFVFTPTFEYSRSLFGEQRTLHFHFYVTDEGGLTANELVRITVEYD